MAVENSYTLILPTCFKNKLVDISIAIEGIKNGM